MTGSPDLSRSAKFDALRGGRALPMIRPDTETAAHKASASTAIAVTRPSREERCALNRAIRTSQRLSANVRGAHDNSQLHPLAERGNSWRHRICEPAFLFAWRDLGWPRGCSAVLGSSRQAPSDLRKGGFNTVFRVCPDGAIRVALDNPAFRSGYTCSCPQTHISSECETHPYSNPDCGSPRQWLWNPELRLAASFDCPCELAERAGSNGRAVARFFSRKPLAGQNRCGCTSG